MRRFGLNPLQKVLLVLGGGIVLPASLLVYIGFRQIATQRTASRVLLEASYRELVDSKAEMIESLLRQSLQKNAESVRGDSPDEILESLRELEHNLFVQQPFLIRRDQGVIYPQVTVLRPEHTDADIDLLADPPSSRLTRKAIELESTDRRLPVAATLYKRALSSAPSTAMKAELLHRISITHAKLGELNDAAKYARQAADLFLSSRGASWKWVIASYNYADWASQAGQNREVGSQLLSLYRNIVMSEEPFGIGPRTQLIKEKTDSLLQHLQANELLSDPVAQYYKNLKEEEEYMARSRAFISAINLLLPPRVWLTRQTSPPVQINTVHEILREQPVELVYWFLPELPDGGHLIAGFSLDIPTLAEIMRNRIMPQVITGAEPLLSLADSSGRFLAGETPPHSAAPLAFHKMSELFPGWQLQARERNPGQTEKAARRYLFLYSAFLILVAAAISLSVWITARSLAREVELGRLKSEFVSSVSHQLKTPLSLIKLHSETLSLDRIADADKKRKYTSIIARECDRLTHLIDRVLDFSRIEVGRRKYSFNNEDLASVVEAAIESCQPQAEMSGKTITPHGLSQLITVRADAQALKQAVLNLVDNAIKYSPKHTEINVSLRADGQWGSVSVEDKGIGISPQEQKRIFDEFYRGSRPEISSVRGTGLGLALVSHTVRAHGGRITVDSSPGDGSTFSIKIPLAKESRHRAKTKPGNHPAR